MLVSFTEDTRTSSPDHVDAVNVKYRSLGPVHACSVAVVSLENNTDRGVSRLFFHIPCPELKMRRKQGWYHVSDRCKIY